MEKNTISEQQAVSMTDELQLLMENNIALTNAMQVIGGKWKLLLLNSIRLDCPARFGELRKKMQDITHATLTAQLRELEQDGIIERKVYAEVPPRVEYKLTPLGITLVPIITSLCDWGEAYKNRMV
ncbi:transcriptional regulator, HxlR family [Chitinophaga jiangningensis]|uniref:Transcriptional regulator, HxlR family n=1 Tax=Chitinophaga jiangningensis TaxID=1419482 RepID=A0A1M7L6E6_9BACT|nr:helix-turn-helix domain-containing protein [Chitinophaga jiangningensis]SHM73378.1 transcriptional regulator, HxlR family [Chitinophaga jiangningensis]